MIFSSRPSWSCIYICLHCTRVTDVNWMIYSLRMCTSHAWFSIKDWKSLNLWLFMDYNKTACFRYHNYLQSNKTFMRLQQGKFIESSSTSTEIFSSSKWGLTCHCRQLQWQWQAGHTGRQHNHPETQTHALTGLLQHLK